ncbi:hypothetical protein B0H65DRAFT_566462 [Neurospora tetraspora]|uniref:Uncharacterized protein n=1 Tax=Neurospora tetraspora TaxID=94610 RepID=A0AAE0IZV3_9PEZI|nr:hypothetical protein B0H65DRAFT_566462 [Neurospora tetraspora]
MLRRRLGRETNPDDLIFNPQAYNFKSDPNIVWLQDPLECFRQDEARQFEQVQQIIRERLRGLGPGVDYAVVRAGPHDTQNEHDELGTVVRWTNNRTGRTYNVTSDADLHITLYAGMKNGKRGDELYFQGHIYLEKKQRPDSDDSGDFDYVYLADPSTRLYPKPGEPPASEEWHYTTNTFRKTS